MSWPYPLAALDYFDGGWPDPIPVNAFKQPLVKGFTGAHDYWPERAQIERWVEQFPKSHIGLRLPHGFLALDFDMYDGKAGRVTMEQYKQKCGPLPPTHISTSRRDGSGIRVYRLPDGWDGQEFADPGPGVEAIKWCHRHVMAAPSIHHRDGRPPYDWFAPVGGRMVRMVDEFPDLDRVEAVLPLSWCEGLRKATALPTAPGEAGDLSAWFSASGGTKAQPCPVMRSTVAYYVYRIGEAGPDGGAHPAMNIAIHALCGDAAEGHRGLHQALAEVRDAYVLAVAGRRAERVALKELRRSLDGELSKRELVPASDPCRGA